MINRFKRIMREYVEITSKDGTRVKRSVIERIPAAALVLALGVVLIRSAWLCDDAYISFRTVDNFINGYGLTWNVTERVQAYTHPLWIFFLSAFYFFTHEIYYTSIMLSIIVSLLSTYIVVFHIASSRISSILGASILIFSKAFIDYSASGLENPLTHLLIAVFFVLYLKSETAGYRNLFFLSLVSAFAVLNRMDTVLLFLPALLHQATRGNTRRRVGVVALGFLPFILWECFSLFYYGFLFPNTAYAKLNTGIPAGDLWKQGVYYLMDSLRQDPLTLVATICAVSIPLVMKKRNLVAPALGIILYIVYVIRIGGDFMSGRFLTAPLFCSVVLIASAGLTSRVSLAAMGMVVGLGFLSPQPAILTGRQYAYTNPSISEVLNDYPRYHGILDERKVYYPGSGLLKAMDGTDRPIWPYNRSSIKGSMMRTKGRSLGIYNIIGMFGFFSGPDVEIIDVHALSDPLLARLPAAWTPQWRIGHFERVIPAGYLDTLVQGRDMFCDERLGAYYDRLALITRGNLLSTRRLIEIWNMNTGKYDDLIDYGFYKSLDVDLNAEGLDDNIPALESLLTRHDNPYVHYKLGLAFMKKGMTDQAMQHLKMAANAMPYDRCARSALEKAGQDISSRSRHGTKTVERKILSSSSIH